VVGITGATGSMAVVAAEGGSRSITIPIIFPVPPLLLAVRDSSMAVQEQSTLNCQLRLLAVF